MTHRLSDRPSASETRREAGVDETVHAEGRTTGSIDVDPSDPGHVLVQRFRLAVTAGPNAGASFESTGERCVIGTHKSTDFRLDDDTVSRFHCEIDPTSGRPILRDLGSKNGTRVDGVSSLSVQLHAGARLTLGRSQIVFEPSQDQTKVAISERDSFGSLVGRSVAMRRVFKLLEQAATNDATVLLQGETGTGKEVAAESIHRESARAKKPFVVVDCAAMPPHLLESELFGHERGAFTGAIGTREGAFEEANGGTIFLDEIGELPLDLQPKLLRFLDKREVKRIGSNKYVGVDVRVIAATNRDLKREVNEKRFRPDLYYRLGVIQVHLPSLRKRPEDIGLLVDALLKILEPQYQGQTAALRSRAFQAELRAHAWPGNVRELRNYIERSLALHAPPSIADEPTAPSSRGMTIARLASPTLPLKVAREGWTRALERHYLEGMMQRNGGNLAAAARAAEVDRMHFYRLLCRHGLR
jgi:transcriptional regulator with PAS, ATPase and Fis domain